MIELTLFGFVSTVVIVALVTSLIEAFLQW